MEFLGSLKQMQITLLWEKKHQLLKDDKNTPEVLFFAEVQLQVYCWLIEELRISLFAQELKTAGKEMAG